MIKITDKGSIDKTINKHLDSLAATLVEFGPKEKLTELSMFDVPSKGRTKAEVEKLKKEAAKSSSGGSSAGGDCSGGSCGPSTASLTSNINKSSVSSLWDRLLCGPDGNLYSPRGRSPLLMLFDALFMRTTGCTATTLKNAIRVTDRSVAVNQNQVKSRLKAALGRSSGVLMEKGQDSVGLDFNASKRYYGHIVKINGLVQKLNKDSTYEEAKDQVELLNALSEDGDVAEILDMQAEFVVLDSVLDSAIEMGNDKAIDEVLTKLQTDDQRRELMLGRVRIAALNSHMYTIVKTIEVAGGPAILARAPTIIYDILYNYELDEDVTRDQYNDKLIELKGILEDIDPKWDKNVNEIGEFSNLSVFTYASKDTKKLFSLDEDYLIMVNIASRYPTRHYIDLTEEYYPRLTLG